MRTCQALGDRFGPRLKDRRRFDTTDAAARVGNILTAGQSIDPTTFSSISSVFYSQGSSWSDDSATAGAGTWREAFRTSGPLPALSFLARVPWSV